MGAEPNSKDDLKLPSNTMEVLKRRYLIKSDRNTIIETPAGMFRRVARHVAQAEDNYSSGPTAARAQEKFYQMMRDLEFMPNSPTLMNAGTSFGQLSACFVLPVDDSIDKIFDSLKNMAKIHQSGGGTGFSFSRLRPRGALVKSTKGRASGPVSFMGIFDKATGVIVQGGRRRGANMGILRCDHPDIVDFVEAKTQKGMFDNFNLSVAVSNEFMAEVRADGIWQLKHPAGGTPSGSIRAGSLFDMIVNAAWRTGDPGLVFMDRINQDNPTPDIGRIEATNPCGELPLLAYESCNLASINLAGMVTDGRLDWARLADRIKWAIRFLDDVIDVNKYPLAEIRRITHANRKIGLGVMGFADMLIMLGIPYNSRQALKLASRLMHFIHDRSLNASAELAGQRGAFPNFDRSIHAGGSLRLRNATVNTIAPTGTISIIAGCSSGIEPLFAVSFIRNVLSGTKLFEVNPLFEQALEGKGLASDEILDETARRGSVQSVKAIPSDLRRIFVTAFDVEPAGHLEIQAAFQKYTDNAVSKTINIPENASVADVRQVYLKAHELGCKGITVYRYGSKDQQVLTLGTEKKDMHEGGRRYVVAGSEYTGGCAAGSCIF